MLVHEILAVTIAPLSLDGILELFKILLTAKYGYFRMMSYVMVGVAIAQVSQRFGVADLDGTVVQEKIYHMAGAKTPQELGVADIRRIIEEMGRRPVERDTLYREVERLGDTWAVKV